MSKRRKPRTIVIDRADRPHDCRLDRREIVAEHRQVGPGRIQQVYVVATPDRLDAIKPQLDEPEIRAAERIRELWHGSALTQRRVTASYDGVSYSGSGEMSDAEAGRWDELAMALKAMGGVAGPCVLALVCHDEERPVEHVKAGLWLAAAHWGWR